MKMIKKIALLGITLGFLGISSCDKNNDIVFFSVENDQQLGAQVANEIANDPNFVILEETANAEAYQYLNGMVEAILNSGEVSYKEEFVWKVHIVDDDVLNAFATPGGYIYVYTGLIKYLNNVDDLAGVMGHEIAHADQRHSIKRLQRQYALSALISIALGQEPTQLAQIVASIAGTGATLAFGRDAEAEADEYSVIYLSNTDYACDGAASFFEKLLVDGSSPGVPEFLSTHPKPENRVDDITSKAAELGCDTSPIQESGMNYQEFKALFN